MGGLGHGSKSTNTELGPRPSSPELYARNHESSNTSGHASLTDHLSRDPIDDSDSEMSSSSDSDDAYPNPTLNGAFNANLSLNFANLSNLISQQANSSDSYCYGINNSSSVGPYHGASDSLTDSSYRYRGFPNATTCNYRCQSHTSIDTGSQVCNLAWSTTVENELVSTHGYSLNQICVWNYHPEGILAIEDPISDVFGIPFAAASSDSVPRTLMSDNRAYS